MHEDEQRNNLLREHNWVFNQDLSMISIRELNFYSSARPPDAELLYVVSKWRELKKRSK
jgi:hypothetical protein